MSFVLNFDDQILILKRFKNLYVALIFALAVYIGGSKGRRWRAPPLSPTPPMGSNSFIFAKKCPHQRSVPPRNGLAPKREILDPPPVYTSRSDIVYYLGRGFKSHAYTHSVQDGHHVFLNLETHKFYCLPDNYEIIDSSLEDIVVCTY